MKLWQINVCTESENEIFLEYFKDIDTIENGINVIDDKIVKDIFGKSKKKFYVADNNYLRFYPEINNYLREKIVSYGNVLTILEAFEKYGGDAITEVFDYGSFNLNSLS